MMKNLRKNAVISLVLFLAIVVLLARGVNASQGLLIGPVGEGNTASDNVTNLTGQNIVGNTVQNTALNTTLTNNVQKVNNINDASKDLPQTGENDIYIITVIGMVAIAIGGVAFAKSKKYDI